MGLMIGWLIVLMLITLALIEVGRYVQAQRVADGFPYPRPRLIRRISTSLIFSGIMMLVLYWPDKPGLNLNLVLMVVLLFGVLAGFSLLWSDVKETSRAAVEHATELSREASESLKGIFEKKNEEPHQDRNDQHPAS